MAKYRKDNKIVRAFQIDIDPPPEWFKFTDIRTYSDDLYGNNLECNYLYAIKINGKTLYAEPTDYIVHDGRTYEVCKEGVFEEQYEYYGADYEVGDTLADGRVIDEILTISTLKYPHVATFGRVDGEWVRLS